MSSFAPSGTAPARSPDQIIRPSAYTQARTERRASSREGLAPPQPADDELSALRRARRRSHGRQADEAPIEEEGANAADRRGCPDHDDESCRNERTRQPTPWRARDARGRLSDLEEEVLSALGEPAGRQVAKRRDRKVALHRSTASLIACILSPSCPIPGSSSRRRARARERRERTVPTGIRRATRRVLVAEPGPGAEREDLLLATGKSCQRARGRGPSALRRRSARRCRPRSSAPGSAERRA